MPPTSLNGNNKARKRCSFLQWAISIMLGIYVMAFFTARIREGPGETVTAEDALSSFSKGRLPTDDEVGLPNKRERLLFMLSSFDRGKRLANWKGKDKLPVILRVVDLARDLCESGYDVDFYMISAWPSSTESREDIESHLQCQRTGSLIPLKFMDHFNESIEGKLAYQHRWVVMRELYNYDFFISIEDDMLFTVEMVEAFRRHCERIQAIGPRSRYFFPGFVRYEVNHRWENKSHCLWEGTAQEFGMVKLGEAGWYAKTHSFSNQACWMASRDQVLFFNASCNEKFFPPHGPGWVEYWSGGLQIYEQCKMRKVLPLDEFETFTSYHMTDNKLYMRGTGVTQISEVLQWLYKLKERCEQERVEDSNLLKERPSPPYTAPLLPKEDKKKDKDKAKEKG